MENKMMRKRKNYKMKSDQIKKVMKKIKLGSSFDGKIEEIPDIYVDNFTCHVKSAYFLSHYHTDHIVGLRKINKKKMNENGAFIYASPITVAIIKTFDPRLIDYVRVLEPGTTTIPITVRKGEKKGTTIQLKVTTIPAHHCCGSVMFLFQEGKKNILYTGDFRISKGDVANMKELHDENKAPIRIDKMYVDTTFQDVPSFPERSVVTKQIAQLVHKWLNSNKRVEFYTSAGFGYEEVCKEVYSVTKERTYIVDSEFRQNHDRSVHKIYRQFPEFEGITDRKTSRIHLRSHNGLENLAKKKIPHNTKRIVLDALSWQSKNLKGNFTKTNGDETQFCFSTHCGRDELLHFIRHFNPETIAGFSEPLDATLLEQ